MKDNFTSINVVLDRSGSMGGFTGDTIGGFNTFLKEQKAVPGEALFTLALFDHEYTLIHDCVPIAQVPELTNTTYVPRGSTALLDALGRTITATGAKLAAMKEEDRPSKVLFVVITDGEENASREFIHAKIMEMIKHQTEVYKWQFIYLGANQDAIQAGNKMGFNYGANASHAYFQGGGGTAKLYSSISDSMALSRRTGQAMKIDATDLKNVSNQPTPQTNDDVKNDANDDVDVRHYF